MILISRCGTYGKELLKQLCYIQSHNQYELLYVWVKPTYLHCNCNYFVHNFCECYCWELKSLKKWIESLEIIKDQCRNTAKCRNLPQGVLYVIVEAEDCEVIKFIWIGSSTKVVEEFDILFPETALK